MRVIKLKATSKESIYKSTQTKSLNLEVGFKLGCNRPFIREVHFGGFLSEKWLAANVPETTRLRMDIYCVCVCVCAWKAEKGSRTPFISMTGGFVQISEDWTWVQIPARHRFGLRYYHCRLRWIRIVKWLSSQMIYKCFIDALWEPNFCSEVLSGQQQPQTQQVRALLCFFSHTPH